MENYDLRIDGRLPSQEETERVIALLREKKIDLSRPIRHWTIDHVRAAQGDKK